MGWFHCFLLFSGGRGRVLLIETKMCYALFIMRRWWGCLYYYHSLAIRVVLDIGFIFTNPFYQCCSHAVQTWGWERDDISGSLSKLDAGAVSDRRRSRCYASIAGGGTLLSTCVVQYEGDIVRTQCSMATL